VGSKEIIEAPLAIRAAPGALLQAARLARGWSPAEVAGRLHWLPEVVGLLERDAYDRLRRPAFASGYIRAYARLLGLDDVEVLAGFNPSGPESAAQSGADLPRRLHPLQRTGVGIVFGLAVSALLVLGMWWAQVGEASTRQFSGG
jgi:cytoskeleton protein RodZ